MRPGWSDAERRSQIPALYRLDLRIAQGYFLAQQFQLRDQDLVFATNADGTEYLKVLQMIGAGFGIVSSVGGVASNASTLKIK